MKISSPLGSLFLSLLFILHVIPGVAIAQSMVSEAPQSCGQGYAGFATIPAGDYEIYIDPGEMKDPIIRLYLQDVVDSSCERLLEVTNDGISKKAGDILVPSNGLTASFVVESDGYVDIGSPNAPSVIFKSRLIVCDVLNDCEVDYGGEVFSLKPKRVSMISDSLRLSTLTTFENDAVQEVVYSIDKSTAYRDRNLEEFRLGYVPPGEHELQRTVLLSSGQALTDSKLVKRDYLPQNYISSIIYRYEVSLQFVLVIIIAISFFVAASLIYAQIRGRLAWRRAHVVQTSTKVRSKEAVLAWDNRLDILLPLRSGLVLLTIMLILFFAISSLVVAPFTVDGVSMNPTLKDGSTRPLVKLPVRLALINRRDYLPKRGDIIVFRQMDQSLLLASGTVDEKYLVKRVIALPGERVRLIDGAFTIYNNENPNGFNPDIDVPWASVIEPTPDKVFDIALASNEVFVAGDNRLESVDSRHFGAISTADILGVVLAK